MLFEKQKKNRVEWLKNLKISFNVIAHKRKAATCEKRQREKWKMTL